MSDDVVDSFLVGTSSLQRFDAQFDKLAGRVVDLESVVGNLNELVAGLRRVMEVDNERLLRPNPDDWATNS